jgi:hypothetical protein
MSQKELLQKVETEVANLQGELERLKTAMSPQDACKAIFKAMEVCMWVFVLRVCVFVRHAPSYETLSLFV